MLPGRELGAIANLPSSVNDVKERAGRNPYSGDGSFRVFLRYAGGREDARHLPNSPCAKAAGISSGDRNSRMVPCQCQSPSHRFRCRQRLFPCLYRFPSHRPVARYPYRRCSRRSRRRSPPPAFGIGVAPPVVSPAAPVGPPGPAPRSPSGCKLWSSSQARQPGSSSIRSFAYNTSPSSAWCK